MVLLVAFSAPAERPPAKEFVPVGRMDTAAIPESSGIVKSPKYEGIFWTHNDSGNPPELFAVRADGTLVARVPVEGAPNIDWEDLAADRGFIYLGDIGNNTGLLNVRIIYQFAEPDPFANPIEPVKPLAEFRYTYPDGPFDAESLVVRDERIYVIRKAGPGSSIVYRLTPQDDPSPTAGEYAKDGAPAPTHLTLTPIPPQAGLRSPWISAADLSLDGRLLLTVNGYQAALFPVNEDLTPRADEQPRFVHYPHGQQIEACCFDGSDAILTSEQGYIFRITAADFERQTRFVRPAE